MTEVPTEMSQDSMANWAGPRKDDGSAEFDWPEEIPFSVLGPEFIETWGRTDDGKFEGQHLEVAGATGSGKSYFLAAILHMRALLKKSAIVVVATKMDDPTIKKLVELGWPTIDDVKDLKKYKQVIFWPKTKAIGTAREHFHERKIYDLLQMLWKPGSNTVVYFDEIGYVEQLPGPKESKKRLQAFIRQYWREARAYGISIVACKQRPIGTVRDQHSESLYKLISAPADDGDADRFAEMLGRPRDWKPVLQSLDRSMHQFILQDKVHGVAYITWVDFDLDKLPKLPKNEEQQSLYPGKKKAS